MPASPIEKSVPASFQVFSYQDLELEQENQINGLTESVDYLNESARSGVRKLGKAGRGGNNLFLLGRSQGSSVVGWALMSGQVGEEVGGVVLAGSWLVLGRALKAACQERTTTEVLRPDPSQGVSSVSPVALVFARKIRQHIN